MKVRFLGHSCVEIIGQNHIVIDPDFIRTPMPDIDYVLITHGHLDHLRRVTELCTGQILASPDVCEIVHSLGVAQNRLRSLSIGDRIDNIFVFEGFSNVGGVGYDLIYRLFYGHMPEPGGTPLSFFVEGKPSLLHVGDAHDARLPIEPDLLCLPWRTTPFGLNRRNKHRILRMARDMHPRYIMPVHHDLPGTEADPAELRKHFDSVTILDTDDWYDLDT